MKSRRLLVYRVERLLREVDPFLEALDSMRKPSKLSQIAKIFLVSGLILTSVNLFLILFFN